eukprot:Gb_09569 [translate_table: standard]
MSGDGECFEVEKEVGMEMGTIKRMIEDMGEEDAFAHLLPLPNVSSNPLANLIHYCKYHLNTHHVSHDAINTWDAHFVNQLPLSDLLYLVEAANFLHVESLLDLTCQTLANKMLTITPRDVRQLLIHRNIRPSSSSSALDQTMDMNNRSTRDE